MHTRGRHIRLLDPGEQLAGALGEVPVAVLTWFTELADAAAEVEGGRPDRVRVVLAVVDEYIGDQVDSPGHGGDDGEQLVVDPSVSDGESRVCERTAEHRGRPGDDVPAEKDVERAPVGDP